MKSKITFLFLLILASLLFQETAIAANKQAVLPLSFEQNLGQAPAQYGYISHHNGMEMLFLQNGFDTFVPDPKGGTSRLGIRLEGARKGINVEGVNLLRGRSNYLIGEDESRWLKNVPTYGQVKYEQIYPGIDLVFYGNGEALEHDFLIAPQTDVSQIALRVEAAKKVELEGSGNLSIRVGGGTLKLMRPVAFQEVDGRHESVPVEFAISKDGGVHFTLGEYDHSRALVIDPVLSYSSYLADMNLQVSATAVDSAGDTFVTGLTFSAAYPVTGGAFQTTCLSCPNQLPMVFVTKLDPTDSSQIYSTYLGGTNYNQPFALAVDANGNAVVAGVTWSTDFPVKNAVGIGTVGTGTQFGFIASLTPNGSALNYSSILGGSNQPNQSSSTIVNAVAVDASGNAYISGTTDAPAFPATPGALHSGTPQYPESLAFVTKLQPNGSLGYSALIGDTSPQNGGGGIIGVLGIAVDPAGAAYITGAAGTLWPTTTGAYQQTIPGNMPYTAPFITKLSPNGSSLLFSTFVGSGSGTSIALDHNGNAFITGAASSNNFPVTANAYSSSFACCAFFSEISADGAQLLYSSFLGAGATTQSTQSIALGQSGEIWLAGSTPDPQFPMVHPLQSVAPGFPVNSTSGFVMEFDPTGATLKFSSYLGSGGSSIQGIAVDAANKLHVLGMSSAGLYTTPGAFLGAVTPPPPFNFYNFGFIATIDPAQDSSSVCFSGTQGLYFPTIPVGTASTQNLKIINCGTAALAIASVQSSSPQFTIGTSGNTCTQSVIPGNSCTVPITFTPSAAVHYSASLTVSSNASIPTATLSLQGDGIVPVALLSRQAVDFSSQLIGLTSPTQMVLVSSGSFDPLSIDLSHTTITGDFTFTAPACNVPLQYQAGCIFQITFSPTAAGARSGLLTIATNDPVNPTLTVNLTGTGYSSYPVPIISSLDSPTVLIGTSTTISVFGDKFFPASVVQIGGQSQPTSYINGQVLQVSIGPSQLSSLGEYSLTVFNPSPAGGESAPITLTTYQTLPLSPSFMISVPGSSLLYATIPASASSNPNTVIGFDPATGTMNAPIAVGRDPRMLTASEDGLYLYVDLRGDQAIARINLQTNSVDRTFPYPPGPPAIVGSPLDVVDMHTVPGDSKSLVTGVTDNVNVLGIFALYNDSGLVSTVPTSYPGLELTSFTFGGTSNTIYALPFTTVQNHYFKIITLDSAGLHYTPDTVNFGEYPTGPSVLSDGKLLYTNGGQVWNPATKSLVGTFPTAVPSFNRFNFTLDSRSNELYEMGDQSYNGSSRAIVLSAYDRSSLALTGAVVFTNLTYPAITNLARWGTDGFAFLSPDPNNQFANQVFALRSSIAQAAQNPPAIIALTPNSVLAGGPNLTVTITGTNFVAGSVALWNGTPLATTYTSSTQLSALVPAALTATNSRAQISVSNPASGGISASVSFDIYQPQVALSNAILDFGNQDQGSSSVAMIETVTNSGTGTLTLMNTSVTGDFSQTNTCTSGLQQGASCQIAVVFSPSATGARTGNLTITDNSTGSPHVVNLTGTGTTPSISVIVPPGSVASASIVSGQTANYTLSLSGTPGFSGIVSFSCSGAPQNATCNIAPNPVNLSNGGTASFVVSVATSSSLSGSLAGHSSFWNKFGSVLALALMPLLLWPARHSARPLVLFIAIAACSSMLLITGCGGGSGNSSGSQPAPRTTPPGTYTLQVTATSGSATTSQTLTLNVR